MCSLGRGGALADFALQENPTADVKFIPLDLGNLADVKRTADEIVNSEERLDIVGHALVRAAVAHASLQVIADAGVGVNA
jgi:hypothetical protein